MKTCAVIWAIILSGAIGLLAQTTASQTATTNSQSATTQPTDYAIVAKDGNSQVWQRTEYETAPDGSSIPHIHQYTELATGLNHLVNGQWVASSETINILQDGSAAATNGQHQAYFPADIYTGAIKLVTPDGKILQSQPVALSYDDGSNTVLIAVITNCVGQVVGDNQVVYPNAFVGVNADLRYTYRKSGFEQDVILREQPPLPASLGLNPDTTRIQVLTEFFNPPPPQITTNQSTDGEDLQFGRMSMAHGKAFSIGNDTNNLHQAQVHKTWSELQNRQFLIESVPTAEISTDLESLPASNNQTRLNKTLPALAKRLVLPTSHLAQNKSNEKLIHLVKANTLGSGLVLDYNTVNSSLTNFTFQGDTTYYISGTVNLYGTNTFEGGTVLKYATNAMVNLQAGSSINSLTASYRPAVFTSMNDNSAGETISGSTGNPAMSDYSEALNLMNGDPQALSHVRIAYANVGMFFGQSNELVADVQIVKCYVGIAGGLALNLKNVLFNQASLSISSFNLNVVAQNVTFDQCGYMPLVNYLYATNCIFANQANSSPIGGYLAGDHNGFYNNGFSDFGSNPMDSSANPFQTVGGGGYYLVTNSVFRNAGTTNIDPTLLTDLATKTTYPPIAYTNVTFTNVTTFSPQAQRDNTGIPDLGYHYDPLDYTFGGLHRHHQCDFYSRHSRWLVPDDLGLVSCRSRPPDERQHQRGLQRHGHFAHILGAPEYGAGK